MVVDFSGQRCYIREAFLQTLTCFTKSSIFMSPSWKAELMSSDLVSASAFAAFAKARTVYVMWV